MLALCKLEYSLYRNDTGYGNNKIATLSITTAFGVLLLYVVVLAVALSNKQFERDLASKSLYFI